MSIIQRSLPHWSLINKQVRFSVRVRGRKVGLVRVGVKVRWVKWVSLRIRVPPSHLVAPLFPQFPHPPPKKTIPRITPNIVHHFLRSPLRSS